MNIKESFSGKISAIIITYNEEGNIEKCIDSLVTVVDEIIIVDSFSTDATKQICLQKKVHFVEHPFVDHIEQKNYAVSLTSFDHILSLDADEWLSPKLIESIVAIKESWPAEAYRMNRLSKYGEKWIRHGNWYPDRQLRLWNKQYGRWGGEYLHESLILNPNIKPMHLAGDILHKAYAGTTEAIEKIQHYSDIFARVNAGKRKSSAWKSISHGVFSFFKSYFLNKGFLDGFEGLMVAMTEYNHTFYKYAKLHERNQKLKDAQKE